MGPADEHAKVVVLTTTAAAQRQSLIPGIITT